MIVGQIRYYGDGNSLNQFLHTSNIQDDLTPQNNLIPEGIICIEIKIKAYPGIILYINGDTEENKIHIGEVGVYNILYSENVEITSIKVDGTSLNTINNIKDAYLIITFMANDKTSDEEVTPTPVTPTPTDNTGEEGSEDSSGEGETTNKEESFDNHDHREKQL